MLNLGVSEARIVTPHYSFDYGVLAQARGNVRSAMAHYRNEIRKTDYFGAHFNLAWLLSRGRRRLREAATHYRCALAARGVGSVDRAEAWMNLGAVYNRMGRHREAMQAFRKAGRIRPRDPAVTLNVALSLFEAGKYRQGRDWLGRYLRRRFRVFEGDKLAGYLMIAYDTDIPGGVARLRRWLRREPSDALIRADLALAYAKLGRTGLATRYAVQARRLGRIQPVHVQKEVAAALRRLAKVESTAHVSTGTGRR
jgi:tetratricopeptide (TPR) repeat protein